MLTSEVLANKYWWRFKGSDCGYEDAGVVPGSTKLPSTTDCPPAHQISNGSAWDPSGYCVNQFKAACSASSGCGGFNTDRVLKNSSCFGAVAPLASAEQNIDVYVLGDQPIPPTLHPDLWPRPTNASLGQTSLPLAPNFQFIVATACPSKSTLLVQAMARYTAVLRPSTATSVVAATTTLLSNITVCVASSSETLDRHTDESYTIRIDIDGGASITAPTVFGAMHAMETTLQLSDLSDTPGTYTSGTLHGLPCDVSDAPRFSYRGLMIDSGRHFLSVDHIKRTISGLAALKMNVMHWHIVDAQSFACGSDKFPELATKGAYDVRARYSTSDLKDIVSYGLARGVRVVPEWDMPGHGHWGLGEPDIMVSPSSQVMDVTAEETYTFLRAFLGEMSEIFTDEVMFLGGDEVNTATWTSDPKIVQWLKTHNMTADDLQPYFWSQMRDKVLPTLPSKKILGVWENDVFQVDPSSLPKDSIVNVYQSLKTAIKALQMNLTTTVSIAGSHWYLDSECGGYNQNAWKCIYNVDPGSVTAGLPSYQAELLIGGEVAMWGEGINQDNFDAFVWRAASAAAERLWSRLDLTPTADASTLARLASFACRLSKRGIKVGPVGPGFCPSDADEVSRVVAMEVEPLNRSERIELEMLREMLKRK